MKMNKKLVKKALFIKIKRGLSKLKRLKGKPPKTNEYTEFEKSEYKIPLEEKPDLNIYISAINRSTIAFNRQRYCHH